MIQWRDNTTTYCVYGNLGLRRLRIGVKRTLKLGLKTIDVLG